jgi:hypothetical protein
MTCLRLDFSALSDHPLEVLDQPEAGYILDLVCRFRHIIEWRFDQDVLHGLLFLALQHLPASDICSRGEYAYSSWQALIGRLQVAGDLDQDEQGFLLTPQGEERRSFIFHDMLTAPTWSRALEQVHEDLANFAETEGVPLMQVC